MKYQFLLQSRTLECSCLEDRHTVVYGPPKVNSRAWVPVGNVWFCETQMQSVGVHVPKPDYYPDFLLHMMHREHTTVELAPGRWFVKPANGYKQFQSFEAVRPRVYLSEVVNFVQEWRYYVANGKVLYTGWYKGSDDDEPAPDLKDVDWPEGFCGAVDFGRLDSGEIALVESHHPYACGHYGHSDGESYAEWLYQGWNYIVKLTEDEENQWNLV